MKAEKVVDGTEDLKVSLEKEEALKKVQRELEAYETLARFTKQ